MNASDTNTPEPTKLPAVVLIDDSEDDLFFVQRMMRQQGIENPIIPFTDSIKAMNYLGHATAQDGSVPCAVLTDLKMPRVNGFEVVEWIRKQRHLDTVRVGVVSSSGFAQDRVRAELVGAQAYYTKYPPPITLGEFVCAAMKRVTDHTPMVGRSEGDENFKRW